MSLTRPSRLSFSTGDVNECVMEEGSDVYDLQLGGIQ